jgi:hypothetical protein
MDSSLRWNDGKKGRRKRAKNGSEKRSQSLLKTDPWFSSSLRRQGSSSFDDIPAKA